MEIDLHDIDNIAGVAVFAIFFGAVSLLAIYGALSCGRLFVRCLGLILGVAALIGYMRLVWHEWPLIGLVAVIAVTHFSLLAAILFVARKMGMRVGRSHPVQLSNSVEARLTNKIFLRDLMVLTAAAAL